MITYLKMKYYEWKIKLTFFKTVSALISEKDNIAAFLSGLYSSLKDVPAETLQSEFVDAVSKYAAKKME